MAYRSLYGNSSVLLDGKFTVLLLIFTFCYLFFSVVLITFFSDVLKT